MVAVPKWLQEHGYDPESAAFKKQQPAKPRRLTGLGDVVAMVTESTGIAAVVKKLAGDDCGCERRRELLNGLLPFGSSR